MEQLQSVSIIFISFEHVETGTADANVSLKTFDVCFYWRNLL